MSTIEIPTEDSVEMVRAIRNKHYVETLHMTEEEKTLYYRRKAESFARRMEAFRRAKMNNQQVPST